jgi:NADH dehydrogenase
MSDFLLREAHPSVLIIGGGFGGLSAAQSLRRAPVSVTLLDRRNHHLFQPLLYQVATASLNGSDIAQPLRHVLAKQRNVTVLLDEVHGIDLAAKEVHLSEGTMGYDFLILAAGASHSFRGHPEFAEYTIGLKTVEDAIEMRRRVLYAFEEAERVTDPAERAEWLTFVLVGGGPTGVELAGALAEIAREFDSEFRHFDPSRARIVLVESGPRILAAYPPSLSWKAQRSLERLGVEVRLRQLVRDIDGRGVTVGSHRILSRTVLWAAGVQASPLTHDLAAQGVSTDRSGRILVEPDLTIPGHRDVFAIGDLASLKCGGKEVPGVAQAAIQEGRHVARSIAGFVAHGRGYPPFRYHDRGSLATIGRGAAVAEVGRLRLSGVIAWLAWLGVHIYFLIGFRNRLFVLLDWAWVYLARQRNARMISYADWQRPSRSAVAGAKRRALSRAQHRAEARTT